MSDALNKSAAVVKVDEAMGLVFGFAIVCKQAGEDYYDVQQDHIPEEAMLKAADDFMVNSRVAGEMHRRSDGNVVFAFPLTTEIAKALGIVTERTGLLVAIRPSPEVFEKFKSGAYTGFSIGGERGEDELAKGKDGGKPKGDKPVGQDEENPLDGTDGEVDPAAEGDNADGTQDGKTKKPVSKELEKYNHEHDENGRFGGDGGGGGGGNGGSGGSGSSGSGGGGSTDLKQVHTEMQSAFDAGKAGKTKASDVPGMGDTYSAASMGHMARNAYGDAEPPADAKAKISTALKAEARHVAAARAYQHSPEGKAYKSGDRSRSVMAAHRRVGDLANKSADAHSEAWDAMAAVIRAKG